MSDTKYTVVAWLFDKRCNDDCNLKSYDFNSLEEASVWIGKIKKAWGDSVMLIDRTSGEVKHIELRKEQRV